MNETLELLKKIINTYNLQENLQSALIQIDNNKHFYLKLPTATDTIEINFRGINDEDTKLSYFGYKYLSNLNDEIINYRKELFKTLKEKI